MADDTKTPEATPLPKTLTRTGIMLALMPVVNEALKGIAGLDLTKVDCIRRTCRAIATLAVKLALDAGAPPQAVAAFLLESLQNEMNERNAKAEADAKGQMADAKESGGAAILTFPKGNGGGMLN